MSSKSFVKILRRVIREEVRAAVKEILTEQSTNHNKVMSHGMDLSNMANNPRRKKKQFSKNAMLNDILNETSGIPSDGPIVSQGMSDYPSIGNFRSDMADSFGQSRQAQSLASTGINGEPVNMNNEGVATAVNAMTRDYSAMMSKMKEMDKQKGKKVV
tara:strand:- start:1539 stop:2012 length:474 start_codon:yes stop_codon:yes gene_type:complete